VRIAVGLGVFVAWAAIFAAAVGCTSSSGHPAQLKTSDEGLVPPIYFPDDGSIDRVTPPQDTGTGADTNPPPPVDAGADAPSNG
jgi:hypothetical protein